MTLHEEVRIAIKYDERLWQAYSVGCGDGWWRAIYTLKGIACTVEKPGDGIERELKDA